ncbi:FAD-dependent oxidoreductase [Herbiconiux sp. CPCC 205716]|uniref:FAD-dependent oxidoreductase n=1 Tax=Herbiconiux gentiana TaxID=2970912 RepID=A0ABT2GHB3_9MICO|nr:FAD-dependent oxidoreductase [Herbiconiux gentiana]MCS5715616.1 FAD-dependent oxidoreductase [Herbiconiux gentiana]
MKARLDTLIGRVTMYNLIVLVLAALLVIAIVAGALGQLFYTPLQLVLSAAVAVVATGAASWLLARLFRTRAHLPSSAITGLIIVFVFMPTADPAGLALIALTGVVAAASKFLLAFRGRHILNPVAAAAVVMSVTGLFPSAWWVATPVLLPFVAIGAFLVLWRTRKLSLGLTFVVVAGAITVGRIVLTGTAFPDALVLAFGSFPIVFLAGFMLSEPLTLPPRRWQQLLVAVVVAVPFSIPFTIGSVYSTPEIALVIGNVVAFAFGQRRAVRLRFAGSRALTPTTAAFDFEPLAPVPFRAGQYLELSLPHRRADSRGARRMFSITTPPPAGPHAVAPVSLGVKLSRPSSSFKQALTTLAPGTTVQATWVGGDFLLPSDVSVPLVLAAGGIGVTPFVSQLAERAGRGSTGDVVLIYSASAPDELAYADEIAATGIRVLVIAPDRPDELPPGWEYLGPARLTADVARAAIPDLASRRTFVSGPPGYVDHVSAQLRTAGARGVRTDAFAGY